MQMGWPARDDMVLKLASHLLRLNETNQLRLDAVSFELDDQRYFDAAVGWLGLGDWQTANDELEEISPAMRAHPDVLRVRYEIYSKAKKWEMAAEVARALSEILPNESWGFIHYAFALHELKRTKEAQAVLLPIADKFPEEYLIS